MWEPVITGFASGSWPGRMPKMLPMRSMRTVRPRSRIHCTSRSRPARSASVSAMRQTPPCAVAPMAACASMRAISAASAMPSRCSHCACAATTSSPVRPVSARYTPGAVAPSVLNSSTREVASRPAARASSGSAASTCSAARPAAPDSPTSTGTSPASPVAKVRMACSASASVTVMKRSTEGCRKRHASGEVSPQASPAITESTLPVARSGRPLRALCSRQSACSGSTTISVGRAAP
ncbi:hypothetical protein D3C87_1082840 [compost metagenome]